MGSYSWEIKETWLKGVVFTHIRWVGDKLSEEDLFVGVEGVDDQGHKLGDLSLEGEGLHILLHDMSGFLRHLKVKQVTLNIVCFHVFPL